MKSLVGTILNKAPVPYVGRGGGITLPWSQRNDAETQMAAMGSVGTLFAIVNRTSNATAQVDWKLWQKAASGLPEDRVEVTRHLALNIWNKPNAFMTRQELVEGLQQHVDLTGEGWLVVGRNPRAKIPLELWPIRPDKMTPVPSSTDFLAGYVYTGPDGQKVPLDLDQVIQLRMPNPLDPYRGMGPVQSILTDLDSTRYTREWNRNFFVNGAEPGGIVEVEKRLQDGEFNELRDRWNEQHKGVANAHRVAILEQGKWVDRKFTQRDMQFVELLNVSKETIREAFGIPKFAVGDLNDVNRATANAAAAWFAEQLTVPRLERIKGALNNDFLPLFGATAANLEFDYCNPVPPDAEEADRERTSKANAAKTYIDAGFTGDSVAEALDLPDTLQWEKPKPPPAPAVAPPAEQPAIAPAARLSLRAAADLAPEDLPDVTPLQATWEAALNRLLAEWDHISQAQRDALVARIRALAEHGQLADLADLSVDTAAAAAALAAVMVTLAADGSQTVVAEAEAQGVTIAAGFVAAHTLEQVADVVTSLLGAELAVSAARAAMAANGAGATGQQIADAVAEHLDSLSEANVRRQLGGALTGAHNAGRIATLKAAPAGAVYSSEVNDRNTCRPCRTVNGTWLGNTDDMATIERSYPAGAYGGYVHCEGGIQCRGTVVGVWRPDQVNGE